MLRPRAKHTVAKHELTKLCTVTGPISSRDCLAPLYLRQRAEVPQRSEAQRLYLIERAASLMDISLA